MAEGCITVTAVDGPAGQKRMPVFHGYETRQQVWLGQELALALQKYNLQYNTTYIAASLRAKWITALQSGLDSCLQFLFNRNFQSFSKSFQTLRSLCQIIFTALLQARNRSPTQLLNI